MWQEKPSKLLFSFWTFFTIMQSNNTIIKIKDVLAYEKVCPRHLDRYVIGLDMAVINRGGGERNSGGKGQV